MNKPKFHVVLVHPEIPGNSGQIGRSCMALGCRLHLVKPLGYEISDKQLKRAGMDYWPQLDLQIHENLQAWMDQVPQDKVVLLSTKAKKGLKAPEIAAGSHLVFGSEGAGLPDAVWERWGDKAVKIPMDSRARSLNLSASCNLVLGALLFGTARAS